MKRLNLDLRSTKVMDIFKQIHDDNVNVFPNLPMVKQMLDPYIIQQNHFWIITYNVDLNIFLLLYTKGLVPFSTYYSDIETLTRNYYNQSW